MSDFVQMPHSGLLMPRTTAASYLFDQFPFGNHGAYRSASSSNKTTMAWATSDGSADADTLGDLPSLRRQSRDLIRNEPLPAGAVGAVVTAVVGSGLVPQARIDHQFLGLTADQAAEWHRAAERIFITQASKPHFWDAEAREDFWSQQATVKRAQLESGDVLAVRRYIERRGKPLGLCVQTVEADRIATPVGQSVNPLIRAGIEVDRNGAPVGYHVMQQHPGEAVTAATEFTRIPAFDAGGDALALLVLSRLRPGQTRGVPYLAPVIEPLKQLGRYTEAELTAAVISGMMAVFVKSAAPVGPLSTGIIPGAVNGNQIVPKGNRLQKIQSGMIIDLAPGEEIQVADAGRPNTAFDGFVTACLSQIGVGLQIPREVLLKAFTSSYSAARAAILDAWRFFLVERDSLVRGYCQPCWEWAIHEAVARGMLDAPGFFDDPLRRAAWLGCQWVGQGIPQIDPNKEADAAMKWHSMCVLSLSDIAAQQGRDYEQTYAQVVRERQRMTQDGIPVPTPPGQAQPQQQGADNAPEN